jgi:putative FmdB family regulatory protein
MPTYEYLCTDCGNRVEAFQRIGDDPLTVCEVCGGALRKVFHPAGIVFKGSGFYATDSRSRSKPSKDGDGKKDAAAASGSKEGSSKEGPSTRDGAKQSSDAGTKGGTKEAAS